MTIPVTAIVLTKNEEEFIGRCLNALQWANEVLVLDSESSDKTCEMAQENGARVVVQPWLGWPKQRNHGAKLARNDWVMFVEADEVVTNELRASIESVFAGDPNPNDGYSVDRRGDFLGILLPNEARPGKRELVRLFNRNKAKYDESMIVHEEVVYDGVTRSLDGLLLHWRGFTIDEYVASFNRYATVEAGVLDSAGFRGNGLSIFLRPIARFGWHYFLRGDFRLGTRGLTHSMMKAFSDFIRYAKVWEVQNQPRAAHPPINVWNPRND